MISFCDGLYYPAGDLFRAWKLDDPEEIEAGMHELLMKSSGSIGYRMKIFMKTEDGGLNDYLDNS